MSWLKLFYLTLIINAKRNQCFRWCFQNCLWKVVCWSTFRGYFKQRISFNNQNIYGCFRNLQAICRVNCSNQFWSLRGMAFELLKIRLDLLSKYWKYFEKRLSFDSRSIWKFKCNFKAYLVKTFKSSRRLKRSIYDWTWDFKVTYPTRKFSNTSCWNERNWLIVWENWKRNLFWTFKRRTCRLDQPNKLNLTHIFSVTSSFGINQMIWTRS